jgi:hypothetical protein
LEVQLPAAAALLSKPSEERLYLDSLLESPSGRDGLASGPWVKCVVRAQVRRPCKAHRKVRTILQAPQDIAARRVVRCGDSHAVIAPLAAGRRIFGSSRLHGPKLAIRCVQEVRLRTGLRAAHGNDFAVRSSATNLLFATS